METNNIVFPFENKRWLRWPYPHSKKAKFEEWKVASERGAAAAVRSAPDLPGPDWLDRSGSGGSSTGWAGPRRRAACRIPSAKLSPRTPAGGGGHRGQTSERASSLKPWTKRHFQKLRNPCQLKVAPLCNRLYKRWSSWWRLRCHYQSCASHVHLVCKCRAGATTPWLFLHPLHKPH